MTGRLTLAVVAGRRPGDPGGTGTMAGMPLSPVWAVIPDVPGSARPVGGRSSRRSGRRPPPATRSLGPVSGCRAGWARLAAGRARRGPVMLALLFAVRRAGRGRRGGGRQLAAAPCGAAVGSHLAFAAFGARTARLWRARTARCWPSASWRCRGRWSAGWRWKRRGASAAPAARRPGPARRLCRQAGAGCGVALGVLAGPAGPSDPPGGLGLRQLARRR